MATLHSLVMVFICLFFGSYAEEDEINRRMDITEAPASVQGALREEKAAEIFSPRQPEPSALMEFEAVEEGFTPQGGKCLALSAKGEEVAIGIDKGLMKINLKTGEREIAGRECEVTAVRYAADGSIIAGIVRPHVRTKDRYDLLGKTVFHSKYKQVADVAEIHCLGNPTSVYLVGSSWEDSREPVERLVISPDGKCLAIVRRQEVLLREMKTGKVMEDHEYFPTPDKRDWINTVYTTDGTSVKFDSGIPPSHVLMGEYSVKGYDGGRYVDNPNNLQIVENIVAWSHANSIFVFNANQQGGEAKRMRFMPIFSKPKPVFWYLWFENGIVGMALTPDAKSIVAFDREGRLEIWDVAKEKVVKVLIESPAKRLNSK